MKKVTYFYLNGCPYCRQANQVLDELLQENPDYALVPFDRIEENEHPEISDQYDYSAVPAMFIDGERIYQAHLGEKRSEAKAHVEEVLRRAMAG